MSIQIQNERDQQVAVLAESLYLINLLLVPVFAFLVLLWVYLRKQHSLSSLAISHLRQTISASLWAGLLLTIISLGIFAGGYDMGATWVAVLVYITVCHSTLVIFGMLGLAKAMAGQNYQYPIIGRYLLIREH